MTQLIARAGQWLTKKLPDDGPLLGWLRCVVKRIELLSLNRLFNFLAERLFPREGGHSPEWVSDFYVIAVLLIAVWSVAAAAASPPLFSCLWLLTVAWPIYRLAELLLFVVAWTFVHEADLRSIRRSLLAFLINILEVAMLIATLEVVVGPTAGPRDDRWLAAYNSGVSIIGLAAPTHPPTTAFGAIELARFAIGVILVLCVVGGLAGSAVRRALKEPPKAQPAA